MQEHGWIECQSEQLRVSLGDVGQLGPEFLDPKACNYMEMVRESP